MVPGKGCENPELEHLLQEEKNKTFFFSFQSIHVEGSREASVGGAARPPLAQVLGEAQERTVGLALGYSGCQTLQVP